MAKRKKLVKKPARRKRPAPAVEDPLGPRGAGETRAALVAAVIKLLERKSPAALSVKEIATEAGVNHGLVHRHFGTKEALLRDAVRTSNAKIREGHPDTGTLSWSFALHRARPELSRILARCCLDGPHDLLALAAPAPEKLELHARQVTGVLERVGLAGLVDPYLVNALGVATMLGWTVFRPYFAAGYKIPADADERIAALVPLVDMVMAGGGLFGGGGHPGEP